MMSNDEGKIVDTSSYCRSCLRNLYGTTKYDIFDYWEPPWSEGQKNLSCIAEDLARLTSTEINKTDPYSKHICLMCVQNFKNAFLFIYYVQQNDKSLRSNGKYVCNTNGKRIFGVTKEPEWPKPIQLKKTLGHSNDPMDVAESLDSITIKEEIVSDEEAYNESEVVNEYDADMQIKEETDISDVTNKRILNHKPFLEEHFNGITPKVEPLSEEETIDNAGKKQEAEVSNQKIKEEPIDDESDALGLSLECMLCAKVFKTMPGLKAHVIAQHAYKTVKRRTGSGGSSPKKKTLSKYTCRTCKRSFTTSTDLMVHETCHYNFVCYNCNERFDNVSALQKHAETCRKRKSKSKKVKKR